MGARRAGLRIRSGSGSWSRRLKFKKTGFGSRHHSDFFPDTFVCWFLSEKFEKLTWKMGKIYKNMKLCTCWNNFWKARVNPDCAESPDSQPWRRKLKHVEYKLLLGAVAGIIAMVVKVANHTICHKSKYLLYISEKECLSSTFFLNVFWCHTATILWLL